MIAKSAKQFNFKKQSLSLAGNIAEAIHMILKTYERLSSLEDGRFRVQMKGRNKKTGESSNQQVCLLLPSWVHIASCDVGGTGG